jgi:ferrochelatase
VQQRLPDMHVVHAMRYGSPSLAAALDALRRQGFMQVLVLPLYPQYSAATTASARDVVERGLSAGRPAPGRVRHAHATAGLADVRTARATREAPPVATARGPQPSALEARIIEDYHRDPGWIDAVAGSIRAHWAAHGRGERLLFSFHGIPQRVVDGGDPYAAQCEGSTGAIATALGIGRDEVLLTYQSRFGRARWLQPYTLPTLQALARAGVRRVDVACPGFAVDCLETLEEIAMQNAEAFRAAGGQALRYIPCLNDAPAHADALAAIARKALQAWAQA